MSIADGTGISASRLRSDAQCARGVQSRNGAAPGTYCVYIEHRHPNRETCHFALGAGLGFAVYQGDVSGGSPHVE